MTAAVSTPATNRWWLVLLQGIAAIILGLLLLASPGAAVATLVVFIGIYWLVDGLFSIIRIFMGGSDLHWGWLLLRGVVGIIAGILVLQHPATATLILPWVLVIILGVQGLIIGVIGLIEAFRGGGWGAGILGALNALFGLILLGNSLVATTMLPWILGILGLVGGIFLIIISFQVRSAEKKAAIV